MPSDCYSGKQFYYERYSDELGAYSIAAYGRDCKINKMLLSSGIEQPDKMFSFLFKSEHKKPVSPSAALGVEGKK